MTERRMVIDDIIQKTKLKLDEEGVGGCGCNSLVRCGRLSSGQERTCHIHSGQSFLILSLRGHRSLPGHHVLRKDHGVTIDYDS